ncbi:hypothetical protein INT47_008070 [Mucor saturninus]|uniref:Uncharacterized protein n=1 Tax=Mucor saturninus TaxID=64648 RepID=A0A8H7R7P8_9FUNG|nr:hypothetical protein INT47_008070 [Mucor saturninus]
MARGGITDGIAQKYVRDLIAIDEANDKNEIFRVYCSVQSILHVELKWTYTSRCFIVSAFLEVSNEYGVVLATLDGWNLITKLLQLTEKQRNGLEQLALEYGAIKYSQFKGCRVRSEEASEPAGEAAFKEKQNALLDCTLDTLFEKAKTIGSRWIYGTSMKNKQEPSNPVLEIKKKIKVLDIRNADSVTYAYDEVRNALK